MIKKIFTVFIINIFLLSGAVCVSAGDDGVKRLTIGEAASLAVERSSELKNLDENAYLNELNRTQLENQKRESTTETQFINAMISLFQNELRQAMFGENKALQRLSIEFLITKYFAAVISAERDLFLYDISLELSEKNLKIAETRHNLGMLSKNAFETQKHNHEKEIANRGAKTIAIENAYRALNGMTGQDLDARYELVLDAPYEPLGDYDIDLYIQESAAVNTAIKNKENDLRLAEYRLNITGDNVSKEDLEINLRQARRALSDAIENFGEKLISCHKDIKNIEKQFALNQRDYEEMQIQLVIKETQFGLGKLTQTDVDNHKYQMLQLEIKILNQANDHYIKKIQFLNPDLL